MGHSSADMVYDVYTHLDEERENSDKLLNDYISEKILKSETKQVAKFELILTRNEENKVEIKILNEIPENNKSKDLIIINKINSYIQNSQKLIK